jgi:hypothetical protein
LREGGFIVWGKWCGLTSGWWIKRTCNPMWWVKMLEVKSKGAIMERGIQKEVKLCILLWLSTIRGLISRKTQEKQYIEINQLK